MGGWWWTRSRWGTGMFGEPWMRDGVQSEGFPVSSDKWNSSFLPLTQSHRSEFFIFLCSGSRQTCGGCKKGKQWKSDSLSHGLCDLLVTGRWHFWLLKEKWPSGKLSVMTQKGWVGRAGALTELKEWNPGFSVWLCHLSGSMSTCFLQKPGKETVCFPSGWGRAAELPLVFWKGWRSSPEVMELNLSWI